MIPSRQAQRDRRSWRQSVSRSLWEVVPSRSMPAKRSISLRPKAPPHQRQAKPKHGRTEEAPHFLQCKARKILRSSPLLPYSLSILHDRIVSVVLSIRYGHLPPLSNDVICSLGLEPVARISSERLGLPVCCFEFQSRRLRELDRSNVLTSVATQLGHSSSVVWPVKTRGYLI